MSLFVRPEPGQRLSEAMARPACEAEPLVVGVIHEGDSSFQLHFFQLTLSGDPRGLAYRATARATRSFPSLGADLHVHS